LQLYVEKARLEEAAEGSFDQLKSIMDVGDIVGVEGGLKRTEKGELSVVATQLQVSMRPNSMFSGHHRVAALGCAQCRMHVAQASCWCV